MTAGVDEVALAPLHERVRSALVDRIGISRRKATMTVLLSGVFTVSFTVTLLVVVLALAALGLFALESAICATFVPLVFPVSFDQQTHDWLLG